jgi:hypothetical protein
MRDGENVAFLLFSRQQPRQQRWHRYRRREDERTDGERSLLVLRTISRISSLLLFLVPSSSSAVAASIRAVAALPPPKRPPAQPGYTGSSSCRLRPR